MYALQLNIAPGYDEALCIAVRITKKIDCTVHLSEAQFTTSTTEK